MQVIEKGAKLENLQYLRFIAAALIAFSHTLAFASTKYGFDIRPDFAFGAGVDLFFLISGFIMYCTSSRYFFTTDGAIKFAVRRVARIVPLYWMVTTVYLLFLSMTSTGITFSNSEIIASYLFYPYQEQADEGVFFFPVYNLGWTLNYEMFFYLLFSSSMIFTRTRAALMVLFTLCVLVVIGRYLTPSAGVVYFWSRPIILEFGIGVVIGILFENRWTLSKFTRLLILFGACAFLFFQPFREFHSPIGGTHPNEFGRVLTWGLPAAAILCAAVLGEEQKSSRRADIFRLLGDSSYSTYLIHPLIIIFVGQILGIIIGQSFFSGILLCVICLIVVPFASVINYIYFEIPSGQLCVRLLDGIFTRRNRDSSL